MHEWRSGCPAQPVSVAGVKNPFDLTGRVAIVTGGSRGLGRAMAMAVAEAGASVVIASRKADACDAVAKEILDAGWSAISVPTHVGRRDQLEALVERTVSEFGQLDIIVNNAASPLGGPIDSLTTEALAKSHEVNVGGPMMLCQTALPHLERSEHAAIVNIITVGAFAGAAYLGPYVSSKAALWNLTRTMAKEWASKGIRVNAIAPGPFDTDMMAATLAIPAFHDEVINSTLLRRIARPEEIAGSVLLLASDAGSYMTGSVIVVDGGLTA